MEESDTPSSISNDASSTWSDNINSNNKQAIHLSTSKSSASIKSRTSSESSTSDSEELSTTSSCLSLTSEISSDSGVDEPESNGTKMLEQEYNDKVFECVQKFLSLDQTIDKLIGDMREGFPPVVEQITKYYIKILTEKLTGIIEQTISKLGLDRNKEFFETCTDVKDYSAESVFWNYLCSMSDNGEDLLDMFRNIDKNEKKKAVGNWVQHLKNTLHYYSPQGTEKKLLDSITIWFSSPNFSQDTATKWETLWNVSKNEKKITLSNIREIQWKDSSYEAQQFQQALREIDDKAKDFMSDTSTQLFDFLDDMFKEIVTLEKNDTILTWGKKVMFLNKQGNILNSIVQRLKGNKRIEEVRIFAAKLLVLDENMERKNFKGKNIVLVGSTLIVKEKCFIDVSGDNRSPDLKSPADDGSSARYGHDGEDGDDGKDGKDGEAGESSGNVAIYMEEIINAHLLTVKLYGGDGEGGQNGGRGGDGKQGKGVTASEMTDLFPSYDSIWRTAVKDFVDYHPCNGFKQIEAHRNYSGNPRVYAKFKDNYGREIRWSYSGDNGTMYNIFDLYMVVFGAEGTRAGAGGRNGLGGQGGKMGVFTASTRSTGKEFTGVEVLAAPGKDGEHGKCGSSGNPGSTGNDMAIIDRSKGSNEMKHWFGKGASSKLRKNRYLSEYNNTRRNGYFEYDCSYSDHFIGFEEKSIPEIGDTSTTHERTINDRHQRSKTVSKQTISKEDVMSAFDSKFPGEGVKFHVKEIIISAEDDTQEEKVEEQVQEEISVLRTQVEDLSSHEINLRQSQINPEIPVDRIRTINIEDLDQLTLLFSDVCSIPLDMNTMIDGETLSEKLDVLLKKMSELMLNKKEEKREKYLLELQDKIQYKKDLSNVKFTINTTDQNSETILEENKEIKDVKPCQLEGLLAQLNSNEERKKILEELTGDLKKYSVDAELIKAVYLVDKYLRDYAKIFEKFEADIDWSNITEVKAHLTKFLSDDEKKKMEEKQQKMEAAANIQREKVQTGKFEPKEEKKSWLNTNFNKVKKLGQQFLGSQSEFDKVEKLAGKNETEKLFDKLNAVLMDQPSHITKFVFEKTKFEHYKRIGSTPFSMVLTYFMSKEILSFNLKMFHYMKRYKYNASVPLNWLIEEEKDWSFGRLIAEISKHGYAQADKRFLDHLLQNGLQSSAYRLLVADRRNLNIRVFSESGFSKVRLVESNNPKASEQLRMIIYTSGEIFSIAPNKHVRHLRSMINSAQLSIPLKYSSNQDIIEYMIPAVKNEVKEWSEAVLVTTGSGDFLKFLRGLFEVRGFSYSLHELQLFLNTIIDMYYNYNISLEKICARSLGQHGQLLDVSLALRILASTKGTCPRFLELMPMLSKIKDGRLRALFGAKLQEYELKPENLEILVNMLSHADNCFSDLEQRSLTDWIDIAKMQQWKSYEAMEAIYGTAGYFFILLDTSGREEGKQFQRIIDELKNQEPCFVYEKMISRLAYMVYYNEVKFNQNYENAVTEVIAAGSKLAYNKDEVERGQGKKIFLVTNEKEQLKHMATIKEKNPQAWEVVLPTGERSLEELIRLSITPEKGEEQDEQEALMEKVKKILSDRTASEEAIKIWEQLDKIDEGLIKATEKIKDGKVVKVGIKLRTTQKIAVLASYLHKRNLLAQVNTGEGKSYIIASLAVLKILMARIDKKEATVDVITSSSVLAQRDSEEMRSFYKYFDITVAHNCDEDLNKRQEVYKCDVVYGDIPRFERDYLLHDFYMKNILGRRKRDVVIVDEVDSMLLDNGNNMLYLSHNVPGLDLLESLFVFMHKHIYSHSWTGDEEEESMTSELKKAVLSDLYGLITRKDLEQLVESEKDKAQIPKIWRILLKNNVIGNEGHLIGSGDDKFAEELSKQVSPKMACNIRSTITIIQNRHQEIRIPDYLKPFILIHLDEFVDNAFKGLFLRHNDEYVVDLDRTKRSSDLHPVVTIIDKGTGTDLSTSQWNEGLHQFLQMKHGCRVTSLSLKAVFVSNVAYLKAYEEIHGFSGTLGSKEESMSLKSLYDADVIRIPTWKPKNFNENAPVLATKTTVWVKNIYDEIYDQFKADRSVLLICKSIADLRKIHQLLVERAKEKNRWIEQFEKAVLYQREFDEFDFEQTSGLEECKLIISTNLAGRGTDIKLSDSLAEAGGLHVIISFLPENSRIEDQAYGRAARCGQPGSGQIIALIDENIDGAQNIFQLKQFRDNTEIHRLRSLKKFYDFHINVEESCLEYFKHHCSRALAEIHAVTEDELPSVTQVIYLALLDEWAMWLDSQTERIKRCEQVANKQDKDEIIQMARDFLEKHPLPNTNNLEEQLTCTEWIKTPQSLITIALSFQAQSYKEEHQKEKLQQLAMGFLGNIQERFPDYIAEVYYYKGIFRLQETKSFKNTKGSELISIGTDLEDAPDFAVQHNERYITEAMDDLIRSRSEFLKRVKLCKQRGDIVMKMKQQTEGNLLSEGYLRQQEENIAVLEAFIGNIEDIIGHTVKLSDFELSTDKYNRSMYRKKDFENAGIISPIVLTKNLSLDALKQVAHGNAVPLLQLYTYLNQMNGLEIYKQTYEGRKIINLQMLTGIPLPSVTGFWTSLRSAGCFLRERTFIAFKKSFKGIPQLGLLKKDILLGPFDMTKSSKNPEDYDYFECTNAQVEDYEKEQSVLQAMTTGHCYVEMVATLNPLVIMETPNLEQFDFISENILELELGITFPMAQWIISELQKRKILRQSVRLNKTNMEQFKKNQKANPTKYAEMTDEQLTKEGEKFKVFSTVYELQNKLDVSMFPQCIQPSLEMAFNRHFLYGYALRAIRTTVKMALDGENVKHSILLPMNPYRDLYRDLISSGIFIDNRVTEVLKDVYDGGDDIPEEIYTRLEKKAPWIRVNNCQFRDTLSYLAEKSVPASPEIRKLCSNGMRQVAFIPEPNKIKRWMWYFGIFAAVVITLAFVACLFFGPIALAVGAILLAAAGTILFILSMSIRNRKMFSKYDADEYKHEEFTTLIESHDLAVKASKKDKQLSYMVEDIHRYTDSMKTFLKMYILAHCHITPIEVTGLKEEIQECIEKSILRSSLEDSLNCFIMDQIRLHLSNYSKRSSKERKGRRASQIECDKTLFTVIAFGDGVITDVKTLLKSRNKEDKFPKNLKPVYPEQYQETVQKAMKSMSCSKGKKIKEKDPLVMALCLTIEPIIENIYDTYVEHLVNQFCSSRCSALSRKYGGHAPSEDFLKEKSIKYSAERVSIAQKSDFMRKDLSNIFLKICFQKIEPNILAHMIKYNYPLATHCGELVFRRVLSLLLDMSCQVETIRFELKKDENVIFWYNAKNRPIKNGTTFAVNLQLKNNCFFITDKETDATNKKCSGLYEIMISGIEEFASRYSLGSDLFITELSEKLDSIPENFYEIWNIQMKWCNNAKLIPPIHL